MDDNSNPIIATDRPSRPPRQSLQTLQEPRPLVEARRRLEPATGEDVVKALSSALVLVAPAGFSEGDRRAWLTAAAMTLNGIPADLLQWGVSAARRTADHPSRIVPTIMAEIEETWANRRRALREEQGNAAPRITHQPEPEEPPCTPEQARAIMEEMGLSSAAQERVRRHLGEPRKPTREDYIALGVDPAILDQQAA